MKVKYKGPKLSGMNVLLPIGVRRRSSITGSVLLNPVAEFTEEQALALVKLDPHNFELVEEAKEEIELEEHDEIEADEEQHIKAAKNKKAKPSKK